MPSLVHSTVPEMVDVVMLPVHLAEPWLRRVMFTVKLIEPFGPAEVVG